MLSGIFKEDWSWRWCNGFNSICWGIGLRSIEANYTWEIEGNNEGCGSEKYKRRCQCYEAMCQQFYQTIQIRLSTCLKRDEWVLLIEENSSQEPSIKKPIVRFWKIPLSQKKSISNLRYAIERWNRRFRWSQYFICLYRAESLGKVQ